MAAEHEFSTGMGTTAIVVVMGIIRIAMVGVVVVSFTVEEVAIRIMEGDLPHISISVICGHAAQQCPKLP